MRLMTKLFGITLALTAATATVSAHAQTVLFNAIGSSAQFLEAGLAAGTSSSGSPAGLGATCVWSQKSSSAGAIQATDPTTAQAESGNAWIAWTPNGGTCAAPTSGFKIYAYLQTDSTVGVRCYFNGCKIGASGSPVSTAPDGLIFGISGEVSLPSTVWSALSNLAVNVAATDIRPEDAAFATLRATTTCGSAIASSNYLGLGYTSGGTPIASEYSGSTFHVTSIPSFSSTSSFSVTPVGAAPIMVFVNPSNANGFGTTSFNNISRGDLAKFLDGSYGKTNDGSTGITGSYATTVLIREPLSGTYNTMEFAVPNTTTRYTSQDVGLNQSATQQNCPVQNPLNKQSDDNTSAYRNRVIGTGQMVSVALNLTNPLNTSTPQTQDTLAYAFWSVANFSAATSTNAKYLKVDGVDPIESAYATGGVIPTGSSLSTNVTFTHINDGTYPIWSLLRLVAASPAPAAVAKMALIEQNFVPSSSRPDFVPYNSLTVLHSHFTPPGISYPSGSTPANGASGCTPEAGGDVGGVILASTSCTTNSRM